MVMYLIKTDSYDDFLLYLLVKKILRPVRYLFERISQEDQNIDEMSGAFQQLAYEISSEGYEKSPFMLNSRIIMESQVGDTEKEIIYELVELDEKNFLLIEDIIRESLE